jgi:hypothetical protein
MKKTLGNALLGVLLPFLLCVMSYSQNHGYFASNYAILYQSFLILFAIHVCLSFIGISYRYTWLLYIVLVLPLGNLNLFLDTSLRILLFIAGLYPIKKLPKKPIVIALCVLLAINSFNLLQTDYKAHEDSKTLLSKVSCNRQISPSKNMYWIVCDAYTSKEILQQYYQFNNSHFYGSLENLGFETPDGFTPNYPTLRAINTYLQPFDWDPKSSSSLCLHYMIKKAPLLQDLKKEGYTLHLLEPRFPFLQNLTEFETLEPRQFTSYLEFIYASSYRTKLLAHNLSTLLNKKLFKRQEAIFQMLYDLTPAEGKHFYYIHLDLPHAPFILKNDGRFNNDQGCLIWGENEVSKHAYSKKDYCEQYIHQIKGLNPKLLACLKAIIEKDPTATIILQGDHGTFMTEDALEHQSFLFAIRNPSVPNTTPLEAQNVLKQWVYEK